MKPDISKAPEWANYLAMDEIGECFWYEEEPYVDIGSSGGFWNSDGKAEPAGNLNNWKKTLEKIPR